MLGILKEKTESNRDQKTDKLKVITEKISPIDLILKHSSVLNNEAYNNLISSAIKLAKEIGFRNLISAQISSKRQKYKKNYLLSSPIDQFRTKSTLPSGEFDLKNKSETGLDISYLMKYDAKTVLKYLGSHLSENGISQNQSLEELLTPIGLDNRADFLACVSNINALLPNSFLIIAPFQDQSHETYLVASVALKLVNHLQTNSHKLLAIHNFVNASKKTAHDQFTIQKDFEYRKELVDQKNTWPCRNKQEYDQIQDFIDTRRRAGDLLSIIYLPNERIGIVSHDPWIFDKTQLLKLSIHITGDENTDLIAETVTEIYNCVSPAGFEIAGNIVADKTQDVKDILQSWLVKYYRRYKIQKLELVYDPDNSTQKDVLQELKLKVAIFCKLFGIEYLPISVSLTNDPVTLLNFTRSTFSFNSTLYFSKYYQNISRVLPKTNNSILSVISQSISTLRPNDPNR